MGDPSLEIGRGLTSAEINQARSVADAIKEVRDVLCSAFNHGLDIPSRVGPVWDKHAALLQNEPCAEKLRENLVQFGLKVTSDTTPAPLPAPDAPDQGNETAATISSETDPAKQAEVFFEQLRATINDINKLPPEDIAKWWSRYGEKVLLLLLKSVIASDDKEYINIKTRFIKRKYFTTHVKYISEKNGGLSPDEKKKLTKALFFWRLLP